MFDALSGTGNLIGYMSCKDNADGSATFRQWKQTGGPETVGTTILDRLQDSVTPIPAGAGGCAVFVSALQKATAKFGAQDIITYKKVSTAAYLNLLQPYNGPIPTVSGNALRITRGLAESPAGQKLLSNVMSLPQEQIMRAVKQVSGLSLTNDTLAGFRLGDTGGQGH